LPGSGKKAAWIYDSFFTLYQIYEAFCLAGSSLEKNDQEGFY
jgi:hypothetical protein